MHQRSLLTLSLCLFLLTACGGGGDSPSAEPERPGETRAETRPSGSFETAGSINATLGGEDRSWNVLRGETERGPASTSIYRTQEALGSTVHMLHLDGHAGARPGTRDMISLSIHSMEPLDDCPCTLEHQTIEYFVSLSEVYRARGAEIVLERFEPAGDGWYEAAGRFSGTLTPAEESDAGQGREPMPIEGAFDIERVLRNDVP